MILLISYNLNKPGQNYTALYDAIKTSGWWWHHLDSTWIIHSTNGPKYWHEKLAPNLDPNDSIIITEIKPNYWGFLPQKAWDWLKEAFAKDS